MPLHPIPDRKHSSERSTSWHRYSHSKRSCQRNFQSSLLNHHWH